MRQIGSFPSVSAIRNLNAANGYHWFKPDTLRFYRGKVYDVLYGTAVFVSSEQHSMPYRAPEPRKYSVRVGMSDGSVLTYAFACYDTIGEARAEAKWLARALDSGEMFYCPQKCEIVARPDLPLGDA